MLNLKFVHNRPPKTKVFKLNYIEKHQNANDSNNFDLILHIKLNNDKQKYLIQ